MLYTKDQIMQAADKVPLKSSQMVLLACELDLLETYMSLSAPTGFTRDEIRRIGTWFKWAEKETGVRLPGELQDELDKLYRKSKGK